MFIAKVSKGRTIRQFLNGTLTAPVLYSFMWMVIYGGIGIRHEREASALGYCCPDSNTTWLTTVEDTFSAINTKQVGNNIVSASESNWLCINEDCGSCATAGSN